MVGIIILFFIVIIAFMIIAEIFTVLFRITGLPEEKARLQVVSLLTTCGYTTKESEIFVTTPTRRKLAITAMIFGYAFSATLVSAFVSIVLTFNHTQEENFWLTLAILVGLLLFVIILSKIKFVKNKFDSLIFKLGKKLTKSKSNNFLKVLDTYGENSIVELTIVNLPEGFENIPLEKLQIRQKYGFNVLAITRGNKILNNLTRDDIFLPNDVITMYGNLSLIKDIFIDFKDKKIEQ